MCAVNETKSSGFSLLSGVNVAESGVRYGGAITRVYPRNRSMALRSDAPPEED